MGIVDEVREGQGLPEPRSARALRIAAGVSQARLAQEIGVHRMTVARWESGERRPLGVHRLLYARVLAELRAGIAS